MPQTIDQLAATYGPHDKFARAKAARALADIAANQSIDLSFMTPEFQAAQERTTLDPLRRGYSAARRRGLATSLRAGQPVGAMLNSLTGQEGQAVADVGARNFLSNQSFGAELAGRRFQERFAEYQAEQGAAERQQARGSKFSRFVGGLASIALPAAAMLFPPAGLALAGAAAAGSAAQAIRRRSPGPGNSSYSGYRVG